MQNRNYFLMKTSPHTVLNDDMVVVKLTTPAVVSNVCTSGTTPTIAQLEAGYGLPALASGAFYEIQVTARVDATTRVATRAPRLSSLLLLPVLCTTRGRRGSVTLWGGGGGRAASLHSTVVAVPFSTFVATLTVRGRAPKG